MNLVLASSSEYRKDLLNRWHLDFQCQSPDVDESLNSKLDFEDNAIRLARKKAEKVAQERAHSIVIGSDQLCVVNQQVLGKPKTKSKAIEQLKLCSQQIVTFFTGLCVIDCTNQNVISHCDKTYVYFRNLQDFEIKNYLDIDKPYECAGSFKVESMGTCLFEKVISEDPTALIGLPMIKLGDILRQLGYDPLRE